MRRCFLNRENGAVRVQGVVRWYQELPLEDTETEGQKDFSEGSAKGKEEISRQRLHAGGLGSGKSAIFAAYVWLLRLLRLSHGFFLQDGGGVELFSVLSWWVNDRAIWE